MRLGPSVASVSTLTRDRLRRGARLATSADARRARDEILSRRQELERLRTSPRYSPTASTLLEPPMQLADGPTFAAQYSEIFERRIYEFDSPDGLPLIIDGGANVGTAVRFWKELYPKARIICLEPDPTIFNMLTRNTEHLDQIDLRRLALSAPELGSNFILEGTDAGRLSGVGGQAQPNTAEVPTTRLSVLLKENENIDLLKLDIEGAETAVLLEAQHELSRVRRVFVEYHSFADEPQRLPELLTLLRDAGFRVHMHNDMPTGIPFLGIKTYMGMDFQANVFAWREAT